VQLVLASTRERIRRLLVRAWPRGRVQLRVAREAAAFIPALHATLPDAVLVDAGDRAGSWALRAAVAQRLAPVIAIVPRTVTAEALVSLGDHGVVEVLIDGVDDAVARALLAPHLLVTRFTARCDALLAPHDPGRLAEALWRTAVSHGGRLVRVSAAARLLGVTREHLARELATAGAPSPKALLELVRLLAAHHALARGASVGTTALALGYATSSHLARAARRLTGTTPRGWADRSPADLVRALLVSSDAV
jgi:AraC-like DNA-binding protein